MSDVAALIADMVRAGIDPELIGRAAAAFAERDSPPTRTARQERNARYYERKASEKRLKASYSDVSDASTPSPKETSPKPPKEITPSPPPSEPRGSSGGIAREFAEFWGLFPNKVGKRDAAKAFVNARRRSDLPDILAGVMRYAAKADDRPWCNPSTFLNQDRWADQPGAVVPHGRGPPGDRKRTIFDAAMDRVNGHGSEIVFGNSGDAQRISAGLGESGPDPENLRGDHWGRFGPSDR